MTSDEFIGYVKNRVLAITTAMELVAPGTAILPVRHKGKGESGMAKAEAVLEELSNKYAEEFSNPSLAWLLKLLASRVKLYQTAMNGRRLTRAGAWAWETKAGQQFTTPNRMSVTDIDEIIQREAWDFYQRHQRTLEDFSFLEEEAA